MDPRSSSAGAADTEGSPEARLPADVAARLPSSAPPAPWRCRVEAVVWLHRAGVGSRAVLPAGVRRRPSLPVTVAALVRYLDSPVGGYREVVGCPRVLLRLGLPRAHVPFLAVDSLASVQGGRANWALPKVLASFSGAVAEGSVAQGDGWSVTTRVHPSAGRRMLPLRVPFALEQEPGVARCSFAGRIRPVRVEVAVTGPTLPSWLADGRYLGAVVQGRLVVGVPRTGR